MKNSGNDIIFRRVYALRRFLPSLLFAVYCVLLSSYCSFGAETPESLTIAIVQPRNIAAYQDAMQGFLHNLKRNFTSRLNTIRYESPEGLYKTLTQNRKKLGRADIDLIVTVGTSATQQVSRKVKDVPIVFSMVLNPESVLGGRKDIVGASLNIPPEFHLKMIKEMLPHIKTIGIIYDPKRNASTVKNITKFAKQFHLGIKVFAVKSQKDIPKALSKVSKAADVLLGLVDNTVYTSQTAKFIIRDSVKKRFPFVGISQSYVKAGALYSLVFDSRDIGRQTAKLAQSLLSGVSASKLQITTPEKITIAINLRTAEIIGMDIPKKIRDNAAIVYK